MYYYVPRPGSTFWFSYADLIVPKAVETQAFFMWLTGQQ